VKKAILILSLVFLTLPSFGQVIEYGGESGRFDSLSFSVSGKGEKAVDPAFRGAEDLFSIERWIVVLEMRKRAYALERELSGMASLAKSLGADAEKRVQALRMRNEERLQAADAYFALAKDLGYGSGKSVRTNVERNPVIRYDTE